MGVDGPFLLDGLETTCGETFIEQCGLVVRLRRTQQTALRDYFEADLQRVVVDEFSAPTEWFPFLPPPCVHTG